MRTPNEQLDGLDSDLAAAGQMIESLRQQLADSQKREVMLRDVLQFYMNNGICEPLYHRAQAALAATADLDKFVLCEKEPVAEVDIADGFYWADICEDQIVKVGERLYRAKEQEK